MSFELAEAKRPKYLGRVSGDGYCGDGYCKDHYCRDILHITELKQIETLGNIIVHRFKND